MSHFAGELHLRCLSADELALLGSKVQLFELTQELLYWSDMLKSTHVVPAGFVTDFASIPRFFWRVLNPDDPRICWPSVIHDHACATREISRLHADRLLREAMAVCGAGKFIRNAVYFALRCYSPFRWKKSPHPARRLG